MGCFVKQEQWERWQTKRKLVSGFKHRGRFCEGQGVLPRKFLRLYAKSCNIVHFWPENGSQCRLQCVLQHINNGNGVSLVPPRSK